MKTKKIMSVILLALIVCSVFTFTACGNSKFKSPTDFTFDSSTGAYSFSTSNGTTYQVAVQKILQEKTAKGIESQNGSSLVTQKDSSNKEVSYYIWSELIGAASGLKDNDADGKISGNITFRAYSSHAQTLGAVLKMSELPLAHYYVSCVAETDGKNEQSDPAWTEMVIGGKLKNPVVTTSISGSKMKVALNSNYVKSAFLHDGLPYKVEVTVNDGTTSKLLTYDDWTYTNYVIGPEKYYTFTELEQEIDYDSSKTYTVSAKAIGDGDKITDASVAISKHAYASKATGDYVLTSSAVSMTTTVDYATVALKVDSGKYNLECYLGSNYYVSGYGTYAVGDDNKGTFTKVGGDSDLYSVESFEITEYDTDGTSIKKATATVKLANAIFAGEQTVTINYEKSSGGWGPPG